MDDHKHVDVIFQKAFDKVPHTRLLAKLASFGIKERVYNWIENWLVDRKQRVLLNCSFTEWTSDTSGVPQGSVLGHLLFIMFVNDIDNSVLSHLLKFADDTKLFRCIAHPDGVDMLRDDLRSLYEWSEDWQTLFNIDKSKVMHFGAKNTKAKSSISRVVNIAILYRYRAVSAILFKYCLQYRRHF
jgi:hypothetical protein